MVALQFCGVVVAQHLIITRRGMRNRETRSSGESNWRGKRSNIIIFIIDLNDDAEDEVEDELMVW